MPSAMLHDSLSILHDPCTHVLAACAQPASASTRTSQACLLSPACISPRPPACPLPPPAEAAALGLLEGHSESQQSQDSATKEFALPRRITSLCRFLLDHLSKHVGDALPGLGHLQWLLPGMFLASWLSGLHS